MEQTILFVNDAVSSRSGETHQLKPFSAYNSQTHRHLPLTLIAAVGKNMELGKKGDLIWHLPEDLRHFKEATMGATVIMGRKTWESLPFKPLPGRLNIILTSNPDYEAKGAMTVTSVEEALEKAKGTPSFIIGGESIYKTFIPLADKLMLTHIDAVDPEADTWFPVVDEQEWEPTEQSEEFISTNNLKYRFITYSRRR